MPPLPNLQPEERARITRAIALEREGVKVKWQACGRRLAYVVGSKDHLVLTAPTDRVFWALVARVKEFYEREKGNGNECIICSERPTGDRISCSPGI